MEKLYIAYKYETELAKGITKLVICNSILEYDRMKEKIEAAGYEIIFFMQVYEANTVL